MRNMEASLKEGTCGPRMGCRGPSDVSASAWRDTRKAPPCTNVRLATQDSAVAFTTESTHVSEAKKAPGEAEPGTKKARPRRVRKGGYTN